MRCQGPLGEEALGRELSCEWPYKKDLYWSRCFIYFFIFQEQTVNEEPHSNEQVELVERPIENVCLINHLQVVVFPCCHLFICQQCGDAIQSSARNHCPVCRGATYFINVFI